ncbi:carbonic anhydrase [Desulfotalea psychrophila]|uniref:carbonic anhydrase n=1 Tax=Desulfotalea psychrophila (strain LSv54 / DSM 12343) TaxID=177439 RepID=Q6APZ4_DESPS|nr:carbonic anhydrase [Desulfotalea psychrophila]CAG35579.1 probable carbonic anhydrase [Desulfotalea psychrophila LSv54]
MPMETQKRPTADEILEILQEGNARFRCCALEHPNLCQESRDKLNYSQEPMATVLCCSDSRVPPVHIFDLGLGDLFVVRVAGNIVNDQIMGSIEYAICHLHTPLVIVMSHSNCGAVTAVAKGTNLGGHMASLVPAIQTALKTVEGMEGGRVDNAAQQVALLMADLIRESEPIISDLVLEGKVKVVPAYYDLTTGKVEFLEL